MREKPIRVLHKVGTGQHCHVYKSGEVYFKDKYSTTGRYQYTSASAAISELRKTGWT